MKKPLATIALFGAVSLALTSTASAKCCKYKKVCQPKYKYVKVWKTCYDNYGDPYQCQKTVKKKVGEKCHNKCVSWKKHCESDYDNGSDYDGSY